MAKASQLEKALASLRAERDILDLAIRKLEAQQTAKAPATSGKRRSRVRAEAENATTGTE